MSSFKLASVKPQHGNPPLLAIVYVDHQRIELPCDAGHLLNYHAFKRHLANSGTWLNGAPVAPAKWDDLVSTAFRNGGSAI